MADLASSNDYYPFGFPMPGRQYNNGSYRYGFNGKEKDDEAKGRGNSYDFGGRIYDPRLGRWLSMDPLQKKYPSSSPYNFALNSPICLVDPDGNDVGAGFVIKNNSSSAIKLTGDGSVYKVSNGENQAKVHGESEKWEGGKGDDDKIGSFTLNLGDSYHPVMTETKDKDGKVTERQYRGLITRKDGSHELTDVHDVDFIKVVDGQTFDVDGDEVTSSNTEDVDSYKTNGKENGGQIKIKGTLYREATKGKGELLGEITFKDKKDAKGKDTKTIEISEKNDAIDLTKGKEKTQTKNENTK